MISSTAIFKLLFPCKHDFYLLRRMGATGKTWKDKISYPKDKKRKIQYLHVDNIQVAQNVVKHISNDYHNERACIFDASPGNGLVTKELINSGAKNICVFEDEKKYLNNLINLENDYPDRVKVFDSQILDLPLLAYKFWDYDELTMSNWFSKVPDNSWTDDPSLKFFAVLSPSNATKFLRFVIRQLIHPQYFFTNGRVQFILFLSGSEYVYINAKFKTNFRVYRSSTVLYHSLFDVEILDCIPWSNFSPKVHPEKMKMKEIDHQNAYLVRLTPKTTLSQFTSENLWDYYYFVSQSFMRRKNWIIPFLEKWFPNCGPQLIKRGIPVFKYFGDLTPQEVFDLFLYFKQIPEYNNSVFKAAANERYSKFWSELSSETEHESDHEEEHHDDEDHHDQFDDLHDDDEKTLR